MNPEIKELLLAFFLFLITSVVFWQVIRGLTKGKVKIRTGIIIGDHDIKKDRVGFFIAFIFASLVSVLGYWVCYMMVFK